MKETFYHMPKLVMMVGLPGSGKTLYAEELAKEKNYFVHSSDKIREELGDVNDQSKNNEVFEILHKRIKNDLQNGKSVIYDATNLNRRRREAFLRELKRISCYKKCVLVATPWEYCLARNFARERCVPEDVMARMYKAFQMPCVQEGFDEIVVHYPHEEWKVFYGNVVDYVKELRSFDQDNHHHKLTLGNHMEKAAKYISVRNGSCFNGVFHAALTHDIGKPDVKTYINSKGEETEEAHYYNHDSIGSYKCLFYEYPFSVDKEYISLLIGLHMRPYMAWKQSKKAKERDLKLFGKEVIDDVMMIHEADLFAH